MLVTVAFASILAPLNSTMIAVALPRIIEDFNVSLASASWLVTSYLVAMASNQPLAGKLGDRFGRRRVMLTGLALFGLVSVGAALAPNLWVLLAFRLMQAISAALVLPNGVALVRQVVPAGRRGRSFGVIAAATGLAAAAGPSLGGVLVDVASWRAIFYVNIPIVAIALALAWRTIPAEEPRAERLRFDVPGAVMLPAFLVSAAAFFLLLSAGVGGVALPAVTGVVAVGLGAVFIRHELRHVDPVVQLRFFRRRGFSAPCAAVSTSNMAMYSLLLAVPLLLTSRGGYSTLEIGLILTSLSVGMAALTPVGGRLADRVGRRVPAVAGLALLTVGAAPLVVAGADVAIGVLIVALGLVGVGIGLANAALQTSAVESVRSQDAGMASGMYSTSRYFGSIVGAAILAGLIGSAGSDQSGVDKIFVVVLAAAAVSLLAAIAMKARPAVE